MTDMIDRVTPEAVLDEAPVSRRRGIWLPFAHLLSGQVASAVLGLLFWVLAARFSGSEHVGVAAAAMSTQTLLGLFVSLGLGTHLVTTLPLTPESERRRLVLRALLLVAAVGAVVGGAAAALAPSVGGSLGAGLSEPGMGAVFVIGVIAAGWVGVLDEGVLGLGHSRLTLSRNLTASLMRFLIAAALLGAGLRDGVVLDLCWVTPLVVTSIVMVLRLRLPRGGDAVPLGADLRAHLPGALRHHLLNLALAAATQIVPVVAGLVLLATDNAAFAVAWLLATCAYLPPFLLTQALFAHTANDDVATYRSHMRRTLPFALGLSGLICLGTWVVGGPVLDIFGSKYGAESRSLLSLLVLAGLAMVVKDHLVTFWRARRRFRTATVLAAIALVAEAVGAAVGGHVDAGHGLVVGWLLVLLVETVVLVPWLAVVMRGAAVPETEPVSGPVEIAPARTHRFAPWRVMLGVAVAVVCVLLAGLSVQQARSGSTSAGFAAITPPAKGTRAVPFNPGCTATKARPAPATDVTVEATTGDYAHPFVPAAQVRQAVAAAAGSGAQVVSTTVSWRVVQPRAGRAYRWGGLDEVLAAASARGLAVRVVLVGTPSWAIDGAARTGLLVPPRSSDELRRWARFAAAVADHVGSRARYLEVWPSPNTSSAATRLSPAQFVRLLRVTRAAVAPSHPRLRIVSGSLFGPATTYVAGLAQALGTGARPFDVLGLRVSMRDVLAYRTVHETLSATMYLSLNGGSADARAHALRLATCTPYVAAVAR